MLHKLKTFFDGYRELDTLSIILLILVALIILAGIVTLILSLFGVIMDEHDAIFHLVMF